MTEVDLRAEFEAILPGSWMIDAFHFPGPVPLYWARTHPEPYRRGCQEFASFYGLLIDGLEYRYLHVFAYAAVHPVSADEVGQRFARAQEVLANKLWLKQLEEWDSVVKPAAIAAQRELQSVDPDRLSDAELVGYLERCHDNLVEMIYQYMRFTGAADIAGGDLLAHLSDWTVVTPGELEVLNRGEGRLSAGTSVELGRAVQAIESDPAARALLASDADPAEVLASLRGLDGDAGRAVSDYVELVGYRLLDGVDISYRYALEVPAALLQTLREAGVAEDDQVKTTIAEIRARVPDEHRARFDELVEDARTMHRIGVERGVFGSFWAAGLMRRAMLSAGRRLVSRGQLHDTEDVIDAGYDQLRAMILGLDGPSADELAERRARRTSGSATDAPATLGPPAPPLPDPSGSSAATRVMRAFGVKLGVFFPSHAEESGP